MENQAADMRSQMQSSPDDIDITSLWSVLKRNAIKILTTSAILGLGTFGVLSVLPAKYSSEAQIQISSRSTDDPLKRPLAGGPQADTTRVDREAVASQVIALKSRDLATLLIKDLKLEERSEFNTHLPGRGMASGLLRTIGLSGPRSGETPEETTLGNYYKALQVAQVRDTRVINIEFSSTDNKLAADVANRLTDIFRDSLRSRVVVETEDASKYLRPQIEKLTGEVSLAEAEVERFRSKANLFRGGGASGTGTNLNEQQLTDLTTELTKARAARSEAEARARSARELMQRGIVDSITEVQKSPVIQGLIAQRTRAEREKAEAETTLLSGHPRMKQLNANVADLRRQVNREAQLIVEGLDKEAKTLAIREELAQKNLDSVKSVVGNKAGDMAQLAQLEGIAKAKRNELEQLQSQLLQAESKKDPRSVALEASVISKALVSNVPSSPKRMQHSLLAAVAGLILGFAGVILKELFSSARRQEPVRATANVVQVTGPAARAAAPPAAAPVSANRLSSALRTAPAATTAVAAAAPVAAAPVAPALSSAKPLTASASADAIASRLIANAGQQGGYRTVLTGSAAQVLAHEEAVDLASAIAANGKQVVLVDWCADGHGLAQELGLEPVPGLMDLLGGGASFEDVIRRLPDGDVHVVPCGAARVSGLAGESDRINLILDALDEAYDHIVVAGDNGAIRELFLAIQGRFDAAIVVTDPSHTVAANEFAEGIFLGFQVTDIDVLKLDRGGSPSQPRPKMQLARGDGSEARA